MLVPCMFSFSPMRGRDALTESPFLMATEIGLELSSRWLERFFRPRDVLPEEVLFYAVRLP